ncbi:hypothetical protein [Oryzomonas rubra]|uniref:Uncharacterized protein n=1 Tax=Oryzomonas rubra TaxID=2509454 RepID=A0A5A9X4V2_9BACT|nr:hypothetical protein [Oryzomonas rubra]KAA0888097.1 hypothetical protein ET418_16995 [Oryzomonas rubra]
MGKDKKVEYVALDYELTHAGFFRLKPGRSDIKIPCTGGYWEVNGEMPTYKHLDVFLGALRHFEEMERKGQVQRAETYNVSVKNPKTGIMEERKRGSLTVSASRRQLCLYSGLEPNGANYRLLDDALWHLAGLNARKLIFANGEKYPSEIRMMKILAIHDRYGDKNVLVWDEDFIEHCKSNRLLIRYREIQQLRTPLLKALALFVEGNEKHFAGQGVVEERIFSYLGLTKPKRPKNENLLDMAAYDVTVKQYALETRTLRFKLKKALKTLEEMGFILKFHVRPYRKTNVYYVGKDKLCPTRGSRKNKNDKIPAQVTIAPPINRPNFKEERFYYCKNPKLAPDAVLYPRKYYIENSIEQAWTEGGHEVFF